MKRSLVRTATRLLASAALTLWLPGVGHAADSQNAETLPDHLEGDLGGALYADRSPIVGVSNQPTLLPYTYFDYGRFFARLDTFGFKTLPLGYGYLEIAGRVKFDGYQTNNALLRGINERQNSIPIGLGTLQVTPIGGFFLNAFYDTNVSHGSICEAIYAAKIGISNFNLYPLAGIEHYSASYTRYYYGVSSTEAAASGYAAYTPGASTIPSLGLVVEIRIQGNWYANLYLRRRWLDSAITKSPLVDSTHQDTGFISLSYRYD